MVIENISGYSGDEFAIKMLERTNIKGLLRAGHENINGRVNLLYDISSKQALHTVFGTKKFSCTMLRTFAESLINLVDTLSEYLLDANNIMLKKECIFTDTSSGKYSYCYNPYYKGDLKVEMGIIFDELLGEVDYDDPEAVKLIYDLNKEVHKENFAIDSLGYVLAPEAPDQKESGYSEDDEAGNNFPQEAQDALWEPVYEEDEKSERYGFFRKLSVYLKGRSIYDVAEDIDNGKIGAKIKESAPLPVPVKAKKPLHSNPPDKPFPEEIKSVLPEPESEELSKTQLLYDEAEDIRILAGRNTLQGQVIRLDTYPFTIGKIKGTVNAVSASAAVSRMHCRIHESSISGGCYYFEDLNSKNGSYINNIHVDPYKKMPLRPGDVIRIADEEYVFR